MEFLLARLRASSPTARRQTQSPSGCGNLATSLVVSLGLVAWASEAFAASPQCAANPQFRAADFSVPVTELRAADGREGLDVLEQFGVRTIIRYYDHEAETLPCKTLLPEESDAILAKGFSLAVVFQHNSDDPETFLDPARGREDAQRALALAEANGQPYGSAVYFSVDGADQTIEDLVYEYGRSAGKPMSEARRQALAAKPKHIGHYKHFLAYRAALLPEPVASLGATSILPFVRRYFVDIDRSFREAAAARSGHETYEIGAYGSGLVCDFLLSNKLVKYCWLSQSTGWPKYSDFKATANWSLLQQNPTSCPEWTYRRDPTKLAELDFDEVNAARPDFGQWSVKRDGAPAIARPTTCPASAP